MNRLLIIALSLLLPCTASAQINFTDDFDDGFDLWTPVDAIALATGTPHAEITSVDGTVRINSPAPPSPELAPSAAEIIREDLVFTDFEMSVDVVENNSSVDGFVGIAGRVQTPFTGYALSYAAIQGDIAPADHVFSLVRGEAGLPFTRLDEVFLDELPSENVRLILRGEGNMLSGEIYSLDDLNTPLASVSAEDDVFSQGSTGIFVFGSSPPPPNPLNTMSFGDARFDNYSLVATQVPEPSSAMLMLIGALCCIRRNRRPSRKLP